MNRCECCGAVIKWDAPLCYDCATLPAPLMVKSYDSPSANKPRVWRRTPEWAEMMRERIEARTAERIATGKAPGKGKKNGR